MAQDRNKLPLLNVQVNMVHRSGDPFHWVGGMDTSKEEKVWDIRQTAGMVFQNPDNQIIGQVVEEDVGFGPENIGIPTKEFPWGFPPWRSCPCP